MSSNILLYGSYGYTGELVLARALAEGVRPILGGRNATRVAAQAQLHGLEYRAFALDDPKATDNALRDVAVVLNCAGPFARTAPPFAQACLRRRCHYLDITGEIEVFEKLAALDGAARAAGITLLPGCGFDVVPTDCLAAHLKTRLPTATSLLLAFQGLGRVSRGTATTAVENIGRSGAIRRNGKITPVPAAWKTRMIDFGTGPTTAVTIPWGDVATAYHSTGIGNIEVYAALPPTMITQMRLARYLGWLLQTSPFQNYLKRKIQQGPAGPSARSLTEDHSLLHGEARDPSGRTVATRMRTPNGYALTALTALATAREVAAGKAPVGFQTPARAFGANFILRFNGVQRTDVS